MCAHAWCLHACMRVRVRAHVRGTPRISTNQMAFAIVHHLSTVLLSVCQMLPHGENIQDLSSLCDSWLDYVCACVCAWGEPHGPYWLWQQSCQKAARRQYVCVHACTRLHVH